MNKNTDVKVKVTDEYGLFSLVTGNRAVNPAHTKELRKSIEKVGLIPAPIIVNEKMEIMDGQHRFAACQMLNKPIYYIIVPGLKMEHSVAMNANNKSWTSTDYLNYFANEGLPDYVFIKRIKENSSLTLATILHILSNRDSGQYMDSFKNGTYKVSDNFGQAQKVVEWLEMFVPFAKAIRGRTSSVYFSLAWIKKNIQINDDRLLCAVKDISLEGIEVNSVQSVLKAIEEKYNKRLSKDNKRYFCHEYEIK